MKNSIYTAEILGNGWTPIVHLAELMARLLDAGLKVATDANLSLKTYLETRAVSLSRQSEAGLFIFLARSPVEVPAAISTPRFRKAAHARVLGIVDSFRTSEIRRPKVIRDFDVICYSQAFDRAFYEETFGSRALLLPWGTNALDFGSGSPDRSIDILWVGRQPAIWENDKQTAKRAAVFGLEFKGWIRHIRHWHRGAKDADAGLVHPDQVCSGRHQSGGQKHLNALACLDWRWRLNTLRERVDLTSSRQRNDSGRIRELVGSHV